MRYVRGRAAVRRGVLRRRGGVARIRAATRQRLSDAMDTQEVQTTEGIPESQGLPAKDTQPASSVDCPLGLGPHLGINDDPGQGGPGRAPQGQGVQGRTATRLRPGDLQAASRGGVRYQPENAAVRMLS